MEIRKKLILMQKIYNFLYNHQNLPFSVVLGEKIEKKLDNICKSYIKSPDFNPKSLLHYEFLPRKYQDEVFRRFILKVLDYPIEEIKKICENDIELKIAINSRLSEDWNSLTKKGEIIVSYDNKKLDFLKTIQSFSDEKKNRLNRVWEEKSLSFLGGKYEKQGFYFNKYAYFHPKVKAIAIQKLEYIMCAKPNVNNNLVILENLTKAGVSSFREITEYFNKKEIFYQLIPKLESEIRETFISMFFDSNILKTLQNKEITEYGEEINAFISIWDKIQIEKLQKPLLLDDKIEIIKDSAPGFLRRNPYIYENLIKIHTTGEEIEKIFDLILLNFEKEEEIVVKLKFLLLGSIEGKQTSREKEKYFYQKYHKFPDIIRAVYVKWN